MTSPLIVLGGGGHAKVLMEILVQQSRTLLGYTTDGGETIPQEFLGVRWMGTDDVVTGYPPAEVELVNGVGSTGLPDARMGLYQKFRSKGYRFATVVHPSAVVSPSAVLGQGAQVFAGAVVQTGVVLGNNVIVNTRASVDHDCVVADHVHIAPGVTICGGVRIGEATHIGVGATVVQGVTVGRRCVIGAGALVLKDVPDGSLVIGVPGRRVSQ
ncbi:MAG: acetyltransferase [Alicyclobacillus macrosporangiidus]|uniref:acetyltransferase n=1 Tax=Alicyclobacillus macrosporangiidus TaxID=392015 RepID=UPI0026EBE151|nr:acetyltransferase [Alicyclobacillus macrosporangiidus]MCL6598713.1 acetyltransferase [Alicyclobacillus macrosporangiidus]